VEWIAKAGRLLYLLDGLFQVDELRLQLLEYFCR